jgi:hypothetical protein
MAEARRCYLTRPRADVVRRVIGRGWGLDAGRLGKTYLGINSFTWVLKDGMDRFVVKWAFPFGEGADQFPAGLEIAENLDGHGVRTGPPVARCMGSWRSGSTEAGSRSFVSRPVIPWT